MRKRTQLVGFEMGYWKHVQYCSEFLDNALDAIESFQWKELEKNDSNILFTLDKDVELQNLSFKPREAVEEVKPFDEESGEIINEDQIEVEAEVQRIIDDMNDLIKPAESIIDIEPIVIIRIRESEASTYLTAEISKKNIMNYTFEIFDNGTGMSKSDLKKYGKYLASSKSMELKQTRGSQGSGSPSAFSDAQNTTGRPIVAVSKSANSIYATVSEFFTTSKNEKKYLVHPSEVDSPFIHGTYIKLNYLNVKYTRGYVEYYIKETAFLNPHITIVYIDPTGEEFIHPRLVSVFPKEPKYTKPHPSSTNIGDLQDLLTKSNNLTLSAFLQDNFVRISSKTAKEILDFASIELQDRMDLFILKEGYITKASKKTDPIHYMRNEDRVYGKSTKPREKLIIYEIAKDELKNAYWEIINQYDQYKKDQAKLNKKIKKNNDLIEKTETKKEIKKIETKNKELLDEIEKITNQKEKLKDQLFALIKKSENELKEAKSIKNRSDFEDLANNVEITKVKPANLTNDQFNSLFMAFKSIKYMSPPTDTAIPVGASVLENSLSKELNLRLSENPEDFDNPVENITQISTYLQKKKRDFIIQDDPHLDKGLIEYILPYPEEIKELNSNILSGIDVSLEPQESKKLFEDFISKTKKDKEETYDDVLEYFLSNFSKDDDFIAAETRTPTSGKGLAYVVEAVLAYSKNIEVPKRSRDVLSRFVNRTPKLRDSADCQITKAVQTVSWKNYKLDVYDNNLPKGPIKLLVNVSGPFVHLMFKSQSKNALADDDNLEKEIKYCLEAIGRKIRIYINRKASFHQSLKRANLIEGYIPTFSKSIYNIALRGGKYKDKVKQGELENMMKDALLKKPTLPSKQVEPTPSAEVDKTEVKKEPTVVKDQVKIEAKPEILTKVVSPVDASVKTITKEKVHPKSVKVKKEKVTPKEVKKEEKPILIKTESKPKSVKPPPSKTVQTQLQPKITTDRILEVLNKEEWQNIKSLIFKLEIRDMLDARYLQVKLKELERKKIVLEDTQMGKKHWKLP